MEEQRGGGRVALVPAAAVVLGVVGVVVLNLEAELKLSKSQQVRAMAKLSVQKSKAEKQLVGLREQLKKLNEDKAALFGEVSSLEAQLAQAHADREESRNWASTYRDMLLKVT